VCRSSAQAHSGAGSQKGCVASPGSAKRLGAGRFRSLKAPLRTIVVVIKLKARKRIMLMVGEHLGAVVVEHLYQYEGLPAQIATQHEFRVQSPSHQSIVRGFDFTLTTTNKAQRLFVFWMQETDMLAGTEAAEKRLRGRLSASVDLQSDLWKVRHPHIILFLTRSERVLAAFDALQWFAHTNGFRCVSVTSNLASVARALKLLKDQGDIQIKNKPAKATREEVRSAMELCGEDEVPTGITMRNLTKASSPTAKKFQSFVS